MKNYYVYLDGKNTPFIARTKKCKSLGKITGQIKGIVTDKPISVGFNKGDVVCLIGGTHVEIESYKAY